MPRGKTTKAKTAEISAKPNTDSSKGAAADVNPVDTKTENPVLNVDNSEVEPVVLADEAGNEPVITSDTGDAPVGDDIGSETKPVIHVLHFLTSGWCEELGRSYFAGHYKCNNDDEYNALKQFADGDIRYDQR